MNIAAVVLAAGASTRMGRAKQLLPWDGRSLLRHAVENALGSVCEPVWVVLGCHAASLREDLGGLPVRIVENPDWACGMGASLRCGVEAALASDAGLDAVMLLLADQPRVTTAAINRLADAARSGAPIVASEYGGTRGVPALFKRAVVPELLALPAHEGAKLLIHAYGDRVLCVPMPEAAVDIDTPAGYLKELEELSEIR